MGKRIVGSPSRVQGTRPWAMLVLYFDSDGTKRLHFHIFITRTPQCVALLWSYFIPVTAGVRCYSEWMFRCTCGCQWVHFYKSGAPLKATCTTFMYFLVNVLSSEKIDLVAKMKLSNTLPFCTLCSLASCVPSAAGSRSWTSPTWQQLPSAGELRCKSLAP